MNDFENSKIYSKKFITQYRMVRMAQILAKVEEILNKENLQEKNMYVNGFEFSMKYSPLKLTEPEWIEKLGAERYISLLTRRQLRPEGEQE